MPARLNHPAISDASTERRIGYPNTSAATDELLLPVGAHVIGPICSAIVGCGAGRIRRADGTFGTLTVGDRDALDAAIWWSGRPCASDVAGRSEIIPVAMVAAVTANITAAPMSPPDRVAAAACRMLILKPQLEVVNGER